MTTSDEELIREYINGSKESFSDLVFRYFKVVYNHAYWICKNKDEAEDITQEVFLKVWNNIRKYKYEYSFKTWLLTIARNTAIDYLRKKKSLVFSDLENVEGENTLIDNIKDEALLADEIFTKIEDAELLQQLLIKISSTQSEVVRLRYGEDLTFEEIAKVLNKNLDTVKSLHRRGLIALRKEVSK